MLTNNSSLSQNLQRLARFGANISDAFGCYIFLPSQHASLTSTETTRAENNSVVLAGHHSLSNDVISGCEIEVGHGLIGWVARHKKSIHVSPFERDSRTLGLYYNDQALKSFIGIPILCDSDSSDLAGVIACDSKKSFAFSKIQGKLLEDLAAEISSQIKLSSKVAQTGGNKNSWQSFLNLSQQLSESLGKDCIEVIRVKIENYYELEKSLGCGRAFAMVEQVHRLIEQALPPHFPMLKLSNGDVVISMDNMMTSLIENKIAAFCEHCGVNSKIAGRTSKTTVKFSFHKEAANNRKNKGLTLDELIQTTSEKFIDSKTSTATENQTTSKRFGLLYEYKRA